MKKILVCYATNSGSTAEVAQSIGEELGKNAPVEVLPVEKVADLEPYSAVVIGAPMILRWHGNALNFVKKHQSELSRLPVAYFFTAMSLTRSAEKQVDGTPVFVDTQLAKTPKNASRLSIKEGYATQANYLRPVLKAAPQIHPVSVGFFGGKLELFRLKWWAMLFVMVVVQAAPGDMRNWTAIKEWAANINPLLAGEKE